MSGEKTVFETRDEEDRSKIWAVPISPTAGTTWRAGGMLFPTKEEFEDKVGDMPANMAYRAYSVGCANLPESVNGLSELRLQMGDHGPNAYKPIPIRAISAFYPAVVFWCAPFGQSNEAGLRRYEDQNVRVHRVMDLPSNVELIKGYFGVVPCRKYPVPSALWRTVAEQTLVEGCASNTKYVNKPKSSPKSYQEAKQQGLLAPEVTKEEYDVIFGDPVVLRRAELYRDAYPQPYGDYSYWPVVVMEFGQMKYAQSKEGRLLSREFTRAVLEKTNQEQLRQRFPEEHPMWDPHRAHRAPTSDESEYESIVDEFLEMVGDYQVVACVMQLACAHGCNPSIWGLEGAACWLARTFQRPGIAERLQEVMARNNVEEMLPLMQPQDEDDEEDDQDLPNIEELGIDEDEEMEQHGSAQGSR